MAPRAQRLRRARPHPPDREVPGTAGSGPADPAAGAGRGRPPDDPRRTRASRCRPSPAIAGLPLQGVLSGELPERPAVSEISHRGFVAHGMRTGKDKYVRRFSPETDELYFDLVHDPKELVNRIDEARDRARTLKASVEAAMVPNPFRYSVRVTGSGEHVLTLSTGGWLEGVQATGLGRQGERHPRGQRPSARPAPVATAGPAPGGRIRPAAPRGPGRAERNPRGPAPAAGRGVDRRRRRASRAASRWSCPIPRGKELGPGASSLPLPRARTASPCG